MLLPVASSKTEITLSVLNGSQIVDFPAVTWAARRSLNSASDSVCETGPVADATEESVGCLLGMVMRRLVLGWDLEMGESMNARF